MVKILAFLILPFVYSEMVERQGDAVAPRKAIPLKVNNTGRGYHGNSPVPRSADGGSKSKRLRLAIFSDPALIQLLATHHPHHPLIAAHHYITTTVSAMEKVIQDGLGDGTELQISLVQVGVWAERESVPVNLKGPTGGVLDRFCNWVSARRPPNTHPQHWHHAMLLTGLDLFDDSMSSLGATYVGGLCHPRTACSVVEARSFRGVHVAAHELAHSMGVPHDGTNHPLAAHCPRVGYLMGQTLNEDAFHWSDCSKAAFHDILEKDTCLDTGLEAIILVTPNELDHNQGGLPGQRFPADEQCRLSFGPNYRAMSASKSMCEYLTCSNGQVSRGSHPALTGTTCGNDLICTAGRCSPQEDFPSSSTAQPPFTQPPFTRPPFTRPPFTRPPFTPTPNTVPPFTPSPNTVPPFTRPPFTPSPNTEPPFTFRPTPPPNQNSMFPPAVIPDFVKIVPLPFRCILFPPFLHASIGCSDYLSEPHEPQMPPTASLDMETPLSNLVINATYSVAQHDDAEMSGETARQLTKDDRNEMNINTDDGMDDGMEENRTEEESSNASDTEISMNVTPTVSAADVKRNNRPSSAEAGDAEIKVSFGEQDLSVSSLSLTIPLQVIPSTLLPYLMQAAQTVDIPEAFAQDVAAKTTPRNSWLQDNAEPKGTSQTAQPEAAHAFLRDGSQEEPILAATAAMHDRTTLTTPCSHPCGGGTRLVTTVCVEVKSLKRVPDEKCNGLPNYMAPFNESCNIFPCTAPQWVSGGWSQCSTWCGMGLQHRLVGCALPLAPEASLVSAAYFVDPGNCAGQQPRDIKICVGQCSSVDCSLPSNTYHPACHANLPDTPLEQDRTLYIPK